MDICRRVEGRGVRCWIAPRDVAPGEDYALRIGTEIDKAIGFVVVLSRESNRSRFVKAETEYAFNNGGLPIFPVRVEAIDKNDLDPGLKLFVGSSHIVDAIPAFREAALNRLAQDIARRVARKPRVGGEQAQDLNAAAIAMLGSDGPMFAELWRDMDRRQSPVAWTTEALIGGPLWPLARGMQGLGLGATGTLAFLVVMAGLLGGGSAAFLTLIVGWLLAAFAFGALGAGWLREHLFERLRTAQSEPSREMRLGTTAGAMLVLALAVLLPGTGGQAEAERGSDISSNGSSPAADGTPTPATKIETSDGTGGRRDTPTSSTDRGREADNQRALLEWQQQLELQRQLEMIQAEEAAADAAAAAAAAAAAPVDSNPPNAYPVKPPAFNE